VEDHQGKEVSNEVFSQAWLAAESMKNTEVFWLPLVFINEVGTEGAIGFSSLVIFVRVVGSLVLAPIALPCSAAVLLLKVDLLLVSISLPVAMVFLS